MNAEAKAQAKQEATRKFLEASKALDTEFNNAHQRYQRLNKIAEDYLQDSQDTFSLQSLANSKAYFDAIEAIEGAN